MASIVDPVTIDRAYLETLVQRANFTNGSVTTPSDTLGKQDLITVAQVKYNNLVSIASQFATLRSNLIAGGIDEDTINLLSKDDTNLQGCQTDGHTSGLAASERAAQDYKSSLTTHKRNIAGILKDRANLALVPFQHDYDGHSNGRGNNLNRGSPGWADMDDNFAAEYLPQGSISGLEKETSPGQSVQAHSPTRSHYPRLCKRTVVLAGIPDSTTHEEISKVVRGGILLEIYIKSTEQSALVFFLHEEDALRFYNHSRRNDLYINHKRIFITFADRHFHLPGHIAGKIGQGATRNMIIRRCDPKHTEDSIRDDLEHIHNLVVVKIEFVGGSCYIKTNSVHNAMFARTCMMSRAKYKGSRIEWDVDECAQPLETAPRPVEKTAPARNQFVASTVQDSRAKMRNRFATLRLDDDDNEDDGKTDEGIDTSFESGIGSIVDIEA